jgi:thioredoxin-related protein
MEPQRVKRLLELATNIAVLLVAIGISAYFLTRYYHRRNVPEASELTKGLEKGETLPAIKGLTYADSPRTLLIVMNIHCGYCAESVQFYNRIVEAQTNTKTAIRILALLPNSEDEVKKFASDHQMKVVASSQVDLSKLNLSGTPTLLLIDSAGKIQEFWLGELSSESQDQVIKTVTHDAS